MTAGLLLFGVSLYGCCRWRVSSRLLTNTAMVPIANLRFALGSVVTLVVSPKHYLNTDAWDLGFIGRGQEFVFWPATPCSLSIEL